MMPTVTTDLREERAVRTLVDADSQFVDLATMLYGSADPDEVIAKMSPDPSSLHSPSTQSPGGPQGKKWALRLGLAGAYAGGALAIKEGAEGGAALSGRDLKPKALLNPRKLGAGTLVPKVATSGAKKAKGAGRLAFAGFAGSADAVAAHLAAKAQKEKQVPVAKAAALDELASGALKQSRRLVAHIMSGGNSLATRVGDATGAKQGKHAASGVARGAKTKVGGETKKADQLAMFGAGGSPALPGTTASNLTTQSAGMKAGQALNSAVATPARAAATGAAAAGGVLVGAKKAAGGQQQQQLGYDQGPVYYSKNAQVREPVDVEWSGTFSKLNTDKHLAFGWANVCKVDGELLTDRQGDIVVPEDLEEAVYAYNQASRMGGDMHMRTDGVEIYDQSLERPGDSPVHVSDLVESMMFTAEKKAALGLPDDFPEGWWIGMKYHDEGVWDDIKAGRRTGFSMHGKGMRVPVAA